MSLEQALELAVEAGAEDVQESEDEEEQEVLKVGFHRLQLLWFLTNKAGYCGRSGGALRTIHLCFSGPDGCEGQYPQPVGGTCFLMSSWDQ